MIDKVGKSILTLFGIGYFRYAPGTVASFVTCLIWFMVGDFSKFSLHLNKVYLLFFLIIILLYSIILIDKLYKKRDAKEIVIDEFVGQCIPLIAFLYRPKDLIPNCCFKGSLETPSLIFIILAFVSFRVFDILKPFPINIIDKKMKNGVGVMLDDIIAGIYSTIVIYIIYSLWF